MDPIPTPHDCFFRESFGRREIAQDFLSHQLPEDLLAEIDLETLAIGKDSYISKELRTSYSDLVYTVGYRAASAGLPAGALPWSGTMAGAGELP